MPLRDPDATDPLELAGAVLPAPPGALEHMVAVLAVEYRRLGWDAERILAVFRSPRYASSNGAWKLLGEARVREIVAEALEPWTPPSGGPGER